MTLESGVLVILHVSQLLWAMRRFASESFVEVFCMEAKAIGKLPENDLGRT